MQNSPDVSDDPQPDLALTLPRDVFYEVMRVLRGALPRPEVDEPGGWARRDRAALAAVAGLLPETAAEARLAAQFVVADAYSLDSLRQAQVHWQLPNRSRLCTAQATSMMRECKSAMRLLLQMQALRGLLAEKNAAACERAAWVEHAAARMMAAALEPALAPAPDVPVEVPNPEAAPEAVPVVVTALGAGAILAGATSALRAEMISRGATENRKMRRETAARFGRGGGS